MAASRRGNLWISSQGVADAIFDCSGIPAQTSCDLVHAQGYYFASRAGDRGFEIPLAEFWPVAAVGLEAPNVPCPLAGRSRPDVFFEGEPLAKRSRQNEDGSMAKIMYGSDVSRCGRTKERWLRR